MKYTISIIEKYKTRLYVPEFDEKVEASDVTERTTTNLDIIKRLLKDYIDPVDYALTDENIEKEFGDFLPEKSYQQIRDYYNVRKLVYGDALADLEYSLKTWNPSKNPLVFRYEIPESCNHYSLVDDDKYDDGWEQIEYTIVLKISE